MARGIHSKRKSKQVSRLKGEVNLVIPEPLREFAMRPEAADGITYKDVEDLLDVSRTTAREIIRKGFKEGWAECVGKKRCVNFLGTKTKRFAFKIKEAK